MKYISICLSVIIPLVAYNVTTRWSRVWLYLFWDLYYQELTTLSFCGKLAATVVSRGNVKQAREQHRGSQVKILVVAFSLIRSHGSLVWYTGNRSHSELPRTGIECHEFKHSQSSSSMEFVLLSFVTFHLKWHNSRCLNSIMLKSQLHAVHSDRVCKLLNMTYATGIPILCSAYIVVVLNILCSQRPTEISQ